MRLSGYLHPFVALGSALHLPLRMPRLDSQRQQSRSGPQSEATLDPVAEITSEVKNLWSPGSSPALPPIKTQGTGTSAKWKVSWHIRNHISFLSILWDKTYLPYAPQLGLPSSGFSRDMIQPTGFSFLLGATEISGCLTPHFHYRISH